MTFYHTGNADSGASPRSGGEGRETLVEALRWMAVYESANAATPRNRLQRVVKRNGDLLSNSSALMATSVLTSLLGFAFWWVAARSFPAEAVGSASAAVSAMTLVGTLGMFGMGTLLISELPKLKAERGSLISTCVLVAAGAATVGGFIYVLLARFAIPGLRSSLGSSLGVALLIVAMALNAALLVFDEGLVGLLLGHLQLLRNAYFAVGKLIVLAVLAALPFAVTGTEVLAAWFAGMVLSLPLLSFSLRSRRLGSIRPHLSALRGLGRHAVDHNLLNVALFLPRISLPLVVTSVVSTKATAAFYTAWMVMSFLNMVPGSIATTLFAVASGDAVALRTRVRFGLVVAMGVGVPLSLGIAAFARPVMGLFGHEYATAAADALSLLALTYLVQVFRQFFVAVSRVRMRVRRASVTAVAIGLMELGAAWVGGRRDGLIGLVLCLAAAFVVEGLIMAPTVLRVALGKPVPADTTGRSAGTPPPRTASNRPDGSGNLGDIDAAGRADRDLRHSGGRHRVGALDAPIRTTPTSAPSLRPGPLRQRTAPRVADETAVIPRIAAETDIIPRVSAGETAIIPRIGAGDETKVITRVAADGRPPAPRSGQTQDETGLPHRTGMRHGHRPVP